jgi:hypothetical protein
MPTTHSSIPNNAFQRLAKRAYKVSDSVYIKRGTSLEVQREVDAIEFVQRHTSIPLPSVIDLYHESDSWFSMKLLPGSPLIDACTGMSEGARRRTRQELHDFLDELRAIPSPKRVYIGSCTGGPAFDHRLNNGLPCARALCARGCHRRVGKIQVGGIQWVLFAI